MCKMVRTTSSSQPTIPRCTFFGPLAPILTRSSRRSSKSGSRLLGLWKGTPAPSEPGHFQLKQPHGSDNGRRQGLRQSFGSRPGAPGTDVAAVDMDPAVGSLAAEIESLGRKAITATCDITRENDVTDLVDRCVREFGHIDILVNNAGINLKAP